MIQLVKLPVQAIQVGTVTVQVKRLVQLTVQVIQSVKLPVQVIQVGTVTVLVI